MELIMQDFMKNVIQEIEKLTKGLVEQNIDLGTFTNSIKEKQMNLEEI